jgi:hypothetical protein
MDGMWNQKKLFWPKMASISHRLMGSEEWRLSETPLQERSFFDVNRLSCSSQGEAPPVDDSRDLMIVVFECTP